MRTLATPPASVVGDNGTIHFGSYRGSLPPVDLRPLGKPLPYRVQHHKKWVYLAVAAGDVFAGLAVVDLGYVKNAFAFAFERANDGKGRMLVDCSALGHPLAGGVSDGLWGGPVARFTAGKTHVHVTRRGASMDIDATFGDDLDIGARLSTDVKHPALSVIGPIPGGVVNATEKHALLPVSGELTVRGARYPLDGGFGGWDYTHGYLARHTKWRWAYLLGRTTDGARIGMNLVEGFLGSSECAVWLDDELHPISEGRFELNRARPLDPWRITTADGEVDLRFTPGGMHAEDKDFKLVRSSFVQPIGVYEGTIRVGGRTVTVERVLGVAEDQDTLW
ncbi:MAG: DUF2804 domain-containing protein [Deltaproteobacteria bacterium]|nr:DUF2804 domain-containing protein [Deltaproteobacteria bacterium]